MKTHFTVTLHCYSSNPPIKFHDETSLETGPSVETLSDIL